MKNLNLQFCFCGIVLFFILGCGNSSTNKIDPLIEKEAKEKSEKLFIQTMQKHLDAVSNRDLATLKSTMSPNGNMQLILPGSEIINTVDSFILYHQEWFKDTVWTFETQILNTSIVDDLGIAITEIIYREPERDGKPYFNRMTVSYALQKMNNQWYIIKDHASSIEKSTDVK